MKKYAFRLEQVRTVRRAQEESAKAALQVANSDVQRSLDVVGERMAEYQRLTTTDAAGSGVDAFMQRRYFDELAGQAVVSAREAHAAAVVRAEERRADWSEAARKVKALDRLDDRRREEYRLEYDREMEREVDDIVTSRFKPVGTGDAR